MHRPGVRAFAATIVMAAAVAGSWGSNGYAQTTVSPPPAPEVEPALPDVRALDHDDDKIDDAISGELGEIRTALRGATDATDVARLNARLSAAIAVELVFSRRVTQQQIDAFRALGGRIDHIHRAVSHGWTGHLPRSAVESLPTVMGDSLMLVLGERPLRLHLDEATRTGRVRPVWASGFAGNAAGFSGSFTTTIAIVDTGIDGSHTDLAGRLEYWKDYTSDAEATPRDIVQHGTHVTGIACGTGAAMGVGPGTLTYTDSGDLTAVAAGFGFVSPIHLPHQSLTFAENATWVGGGQTDLYGAFTTDGATALSRLSSPTTGSSGIAETNTFTPSATRHYTALLVQNGTASITRYAIVNTVTSYPGVGDGYNVLRGVAPDCRWAGAKVFTNTGLGSSLSIGTALDDMIVERSAHDIKVLNMSFGLIGDPGLDPTMRAKVNTVVSNGIVTVVSAGNDGPGTAPANEIDDPGRAALAMTVAASNDVNELTSYTSSGFLDPGADEDEKPDVTAPGGSIYYSGILSADSNDADAGAADFADRAPNDYLNLEGTSMAAPFAAGAAALVIDALEHTGLTWSFASSAHPLLVKMLLGASATESNAAREAGTGSDPSLGRAAAPKDHFEGYGLINPDAAVEAVSLPYAGGALGDSTAGGRFDRRVWGRHIALEPGTKVSVALTVPATADYDLYLYRGVPDAKGNPLIFAASTNAGLGSSESIDFIAYSTETAYLFVKRVAGSGTWSMTGSVVAGSPVLTATPTMTASPTITVTPTPTPTLTPSATPTPTCGAAPIAGCRTPAIREKAYLSIKDDSDDDKDRLIWKWTKGSATSKVPDFGSPLTTTQYLLCIYDGTSSLITSAIVPAGGLCNAASPRPCWTDTSIGFKYRNPEATPAGIEQLLLKGGADGTAAISVKGKGVDLDMPPSIPLAQPVTVQLQNTVGVCWEATYSAPASTNTAGPPAHFRDRAD